MKLVIDFNREMLILIKDSWNQRLFQQNVKRDHGMRSCSHYFALNPLKNKGIEIYIEANMCQSISMLF